MRQTEHLVSDTAASRIIGTAMNVTGVNGTGHDEETADQAPSVQWPAPMAAEAFHGLAGEIVRTIEPHTEADPAALLIQALAAFGNVTGRGPYFQVEASRHFTNLYAAIVGRTSKARKGTSLSHIRRIYRSLDEEWERGRVEDGLSTGEGLIWAVRDPIFNEDKLVDAGVTDKRLMVFEQEFAQVLTVAMRKQNTLSMVIRKGWDDGMLGTLTKNNPARATGAHVSIVGHITIEELRRKLVETEALNGFANRFLWVCAKRSKVLPEGGNITSVDFAPILRFLSDAVMYARNVGRVIPDQATRDLWREVYPSLSDERSGMLGAATGRAEAQAVRLAMIYALLDGSKIIRLPHLRAALAICAFVEASARFIFGDALGDPIADEILAVLRRTPEGMTREEIRNYFQRNRSSREIGLALAALLAAGRARFEREPTGGRPAERWFSCSPGTR